MRELLPPRFLGLKPGSINLLLLLLAAALGTTGPVRAQQPASRTATATAPMPPPKDELPAPAIVNPPGVPGSVSMGSAGLNLICAGDHLSLSASGGNGTYTWSPNVGLSATTGAAVVVGPLVTTTYTVTSTNPNTGATVTATKTVNVRENCCPTSRNVGFIVEVPGSLFDASTGSPFTDPATGQGYAAGTRFHFGGSSPIVLRDLAFQPPVGSVILMDGGKDLHLQDGASLRLAGVSITAACDAMWGRLWVRNTAAGISSTFTDGADGYPSGFGSGVANTTGGMTTLRNQLSHSLGGIEFEQPVSATSNAPYFKLTNVDFLHNEQSMKLLRSNIPQPQTGANVPPLGYYVTLSTFDSNPDHFKAPKRYSTTDSNYPHYSQYHVWFVGSGSYWHSNALKKALFGFHSPDNAQSAGITVANSQFTDIYLAGINVNTSDITSTAGFVSSYGSTYTFPTLSALPNTPQFQNALANDVRDGLLETRGIYSYGGLVIMGSNTFRQLNDPYSNFNFTERYKQVGAKCQRLAAAADNRFSLLHTGLELSEMYSNAVGLVGNTFTACRRGIEANGVGVARGTGSAPAPPPATVNFGLFSCNTFDRGSSSRPGLAYGIVLLPNSTITFDPLPTTPPVTPPVLTNKFLDWGTRRNGFQAILNSNFFPARPNCRYSSYDNYVNVDGLLPGTTNLSALCTNVFFPPTFVDYDTQNPGNVCGLGNPGLDRTQPRDSHLEQNSPNPATGNTQFKYQLASPTSKAELRVRGGMNGREYYRYALSPKNSVHDLGLSGWGAGLYFVTLYVDGAPVQTRRLVVQ